MISCNNLIILNLIYYIKIILFIFITIIPVILLEKLVIDVIKYKHINIIFLSKKILIIILIISISCLIHFSLKNNKCYMYANKNIINEYKVGLNNLDKNNIDKDIKTKYLENLLIISHNNLVNNKINNLENNNLENNNKSLVNNLNNNKSLVNNLNENNILLKENDLNKLNNVYIIDGVFYYPKFVFGNLNTYSGYNCINDPLKNGFNNEYGYNNYFYNRLIKFIETAEKNGFKITISTQGCRSYNTQVNYYNTMEKGRAAYPGQSLHGFGIASDLEFYQNDGSVCPYNRTKSNCLSMGWAHDNAYKFGLTFPLLNASYREDWHIEPLNKKTY